MADAASLDYEAIRNVLIEIALEAGRMMTDARPSTSNMLDTKKNSTDLVTATDRAVEAFVSRTLATRFPTFAFIGEETYTPTTQLSDAPTFIVDPIDGTTNFIHGYPAVAISLGLSVRRQAAVGVIYNPFQRTLYHAMHGRGAFLTIVPAARAAASTAAVPAEAPSAATSSSSSSSSAAAALLADPSATTRRLPLRAPERLQLNEALIAIEWGNERAGNNWRVKSGMFARLARAPEADEHAGEGAAGKAGVGGMVHGLRSGGSAAVNLCQVAAGELDAYWEGGCWAWDVCAGWALVAEAGGHVVGANPGEWAPPMDARQCLAVRAGPGGENEWRGFVEAVWACVPGKLEY